MTHGVDPKFWGPSAWWLLHTAAAKAAMRGTSKDLAAFKKMAMALDCLLPCEKCRANFKEHIANTKFPTRPSSIPGWVYKLHNAVSAQNRVDESKSPKRATVLAVYSQSCNVESDHTALVAKAAPFLVSLEPNCDALRHFAEGLHYFFDGVPSVTEMSVKSNKAFKRWLGVTALHVKNCTGTCTQKGGCGGIL